ncbi:hypothetical protein C8J56DRAFT_1042987 [Mycena floridula]|nr:hypothetical protein C8J56DRAFT_1042987 [Mycena floridula]
MSAIPGQEQSTMASQSTPTLPSQRKDIDGLTVTVEKLRSETVEGDLGSYNISKKGRDFAVSVSDITATTVNGSVGSGNQFHTAKLFTGKSGKRMSIEEFCKQYNVSNKVQKMLENEGYEGSVFTLCDLTKEELEDIGFNGGQIRTLEVALKEWSSEASR